jgi:hypothetical protein
MNLELALFGVALFALGLICTKPLDRFLERHESRRSLTPDRLASMKPSPLVHCTCCHKDVNPNTASYTFSKGWECKSHREPAPMNLRVAA